MFCGVIILFCSIVLMVPLRFLIDNKLLSEFQAHALGIFLNSFGLIMGGISMQFKILWLLYIGCALCCGLGGILLYQRIIFNHQLWFNSIGRHNIGAGIFGFIIGLWTIIFFLSSVPLLNRLAIWNVLYVYSGVCVPILSFSLISITDPISSSSQSSMINNVNKEEGVLDDEKGYETRQDTLFIIIKDEPNETLINELKHIWEKDGIFIVIENIKRLQFNILNHVLVPLHTVLAESDVKLIMEKYNITSKSLFPDISRFDPVARVIGLRPGQVCHIIRPSKTAIEANYYRVCI
jgi:DNA-directed RNA polymerase subunit H (RpoH/RPB5)